MGESAFELAAARGSRFDLAEARTYIIGVWGILGPQSSETGTGTDRAAKG
jgi:hypothetical protein